MAPAPDELARGKPLRLRTQSRQSPALLRTSRSKATLEGDSPTNGPDSIPEQLALLPREATGCVTGPEHPRAHVAVVGRAPLTEMRAPDEHGQIPKGEEP
jgi:hypothetical protein